ncbi:hypothetical protein [Parvularcula sp. IMCC14364]|uniref:hypothetical protein n=1 Tax=Parvularcula sp. IMCC14364 TaxID=3067902 RepID=UPI0027410ED6|nr:hypothetical protein [Parvularcula sp. IMCC14364]
MPTDVQSSQSSNISARKKQATPAYNDGSEEFSSESERDNTKTNLHIPSSETADGKEKVLTTEELRQGHTGDHVRHILYLSTIGAVIGLIVIYAAATV